MSKSSPSPWRNAFFLLFITAAFVSNTGTWLFNVAAGWLMTDLGGTGLSVALVQTANLLPLVLLAIPAGTLGDLGDRRRIILITQAALILVNTVFAYLVQAELATATWLLVFTFLNGVGAAISGPLLTAVIPQMVSRERLGTAMSIGGISFNSARAIGPILCGWLITSVGMAFPFWIDAASFAAVVGVIFFWKDDRQKDDELNPRVFQLAMADSVRFLRYTPALYNSILRAVLFFMGAGALWALLPLVAKEQLGGDARLYGYLVGAVGVGAVITGLGYDRIVDWVGGSNRLTTTMSVVFAGCLTGLALSPSPGWAYPAALVAGMSWQLTFTSLISSAQYALPRWFGVRGIAYFFMAMGVSLTLGSALWGWLVDSFSLAIAHYIAAGVCVITALTGHRFPLDQAKGADLSAFTKYPQLSIPPGRDEDPGGVLLIQNHYEIDSGKATELHRRLLRLRNKRYRSGALRWHIYRPLEQNGRATVVESYAEIKHTAVARHDERITQEDHEALEIFQTWFENAGGQCKQEIMEEIHE
jgi:MFS family permease